MKTANEIRRWVDVAMAKLPRVDALVVACLACTHCGYRKDLFAAAFSGAGVDATVLNPNERAVDDLFGTSAGGPFRDVGVAFVTRYAIPPATVDALTWFLGDISPRTVEAMRKFVHVRDLF